ncbi:LysR substrate-binding domain-containing protein [Ruegeria sp. HKCCD8929]|uniref:LysR substrate-binding domain-containing protein n=1 Tax=Ruegeria sp. HKCCD8929 TaxID=2683006 RepID=UPI001487CEAB|nr:LysR substrate-binding domain-containing protein [Ruegeria sp. HKCCD8929]
MNARQVEIFRLVMLTGSVTETAKRLHVSQPAISKQMRLLEDNVGFTLFRRSGNRLHPTDEAMALFEQVEMLYRGLDQLDRFAEDLRESRRGMLSVATMPLLSQGWLPRTVADFLRDRPDVSLSLVARSTDWIARSVAAGRSDLGLGLFRKDELGVIQTPLLQLPLVCVCPRGHPLGARKRIEIEDLAGHDLIAPSNFDPLHLALPQPLAQLISAQKRRLEVFTTQTALELAMNGAGVAIVDVMTALERPSDTVCVRPIGQNIAFNIVIMAPRHRSHSRLVQAMQRQLVADALAAQERAFRFVAECES